MTNIPDLSRFAPASLPGPRISDELLGWIATACAGPDSVSWDIGLNLIPAPNGGAQPGYIVLLRMPSPLIGQWLAYLVFADLSALSEPILSRHISDGIESLRQQRSAVLAGSNGNGAHS